MDISGKDYFNRREAAHYCCVKVEHFDRCARRYDIPCSMWMDKPLYRRADLQRAIEREWLRLESLLGPTSPTGATRAGGGTELLSDQLLRTRGQRGKNLLRG